MLVPSILSKLFRRADTKADAKPQEEKRPEIKLVDPLDPIARRGHVNGWEEKNEPSVKEVKLRAVTDFPVFNGLAGEGGVTLTKAIGDAAMKIHSVSMDDDTGMLKNGPQSEYTVPAGLQAWYMSQGFIGYQACAIIAQHWLVDKACSMAGEDAVRNGWVIKARGGEDLADEEHEAIVEADKEFKVKDNLIELNRFKNIFGIRVAIFKVDSDDPLYYEKPFNIDGIKEGSYKGISQVDPYWMMPVMTTKGTSDPSSKDFYDPEYWTISGKKYHKSHLVIVRGPQPADILKPTYIFGGMPLTQRIYERVYAAERTANESPLMALSKRTMAIHADLDKVMADQTSFAQRLATWIRYRDNHGVKVLGKDESLEQFDINLSDFDSIIMNQYQLVAAIARVPATKLLGTSPKGFNATGEFEMRSYHEELESIQEHIMMPLLERHYDILMRHLGFETNVEVVCNEVDSLTAKERAELNYQKSQTAEMLINNGSISPDEDRQRLREDEHSGYNRLTNADAAKTPGLSPENIAEFQKAGAQQEKGQAAEVTAGEKPGAPVGGAEPVEEDTLGGVEGVSRGTLQALVPLLLKGLSSRGDAYSQQTIQAALLAIVHGLSANRSAASELDNVDPPIRGTTPHTRGVTPSVGGIHNVVGKVQDWNPAKLPKLRVGGLNCVIENPRGTIRKGMDMDGKEWRVKMPHHYGYIKGYEGADGDEVDCFIGPNMTAKDVYVISQNDSAGEFDEYKCMMGFASQEQAVDAYNSSFTRDWDGFGSVQRMSLDDFKNWLDAGAAALAPVHA
jgi:phage-related protein (TIGR01555 family)